MAELPILPLKTDALLADTGHMSTEEFGAYFLLLITMWRHGAKLPNSQVELARIARISPRRWQSISERVLRPMTITEHTITQKRLSDTWLNVQEVRRKKAMAAENRWRFKRKANGHADASADASADK